MNSNGKLMALSEANGKLPVAIAEADYCPATCCEAVYGY